MKKIIGRKVYDTGTSEKVAHFFNDTGKSDWETVTEDLYRTPKGTFFLHGEGGPMSAYAKPDGHVSVSGEDIRPMSADEAIAWLEARQLIDELEALFPNELEEA